MIEYTNYILITIVTLFIILSLKFLSKYFEIFNEASSNTIRKIHTEKVIKVGGLCFLSLLIIFFYIDDLLLKKLILFSYILMFIGLIADINKKFSSYTRLILTALIIFLLIYSENFYIDDISYKYINEIFIDYPYTAYIFSLLCLIVCINGFNFIDGNNGLLLGTTLIILINFLTYIDTDNTDLILIIYSLFIASSILFLFNIISGKILTGDNGAYFIGSLIGVIAIYIKSFDILDSFQIACILFYPATEVAFSSTRRIFVLGKNPFYPDNLHLHSNLFKILTKDIPRDNFKKINLFNSATSILIIILQIFLSIFIFFSSIYLSFFQILIFLILTYALIYILLYKYIH